MSQQLAVPKGVGPLQEPRPLHGASWARDGAAGEAPRARCKRAMSASGSSPRSPAEPSSHRMIILCIIKGNQVSGELLHCSCPSKQRDSPPETRQRELPEHAALCGQRSGPGQKT